MAKTNRNITIVKFGTVLNSEKLLPFRIGDLKLLPKKLLLRIGNKILSKISKGLFTELLRSFFYSICTS
jgi:hypothetical protein